MRTPPLIFDAILLSPLRLAVREVPGARGATGSTLVEVTVEHPTDCHDEVVTVTGISFHPGQSRLWSGDTNDFPDDDDDYDDDEEDGYDDNTLSRIGVDESGRGSGVIDREDGSTTHGGAGTSTSMSSYGRSDRRAAIASASVARRAASSTAAEGRSMQGGELSVIDMSRRVRWGYAPGSAPDLPLVLEPYEAFATVIQIDAGEDVRSRAFLSPITVNATVGRRSPCTPQHRHRAGWRGLFNRNSIADEYESDVGGDGGEGENESDGGERIMVAADARWTSSRVGIENSDAFRVDMSLRGGLATTCRVGAPLVISLRVLNLSMEPRDLMLLMAKDGEGGENDGREV